MNFGDVIEGSKRGGGPYRRAGWNGKGMFIVLMPALYLPPFNTQDTARKVNDRTAKWIGEDAPLDCQPYFAMYTAAAQWQPGWLASQTDMLANDWEEVNPEKEIFIGGDLVTDTAYRFAAWLTQRDGVTVFGNTHDAAPAANAAAAFLADLRKPFTDAMSHGDGNVD